MIIHHDLLKVVRNIQTKIVIINMTWDTTFQPAVTYSKSTIETLKKGVKYVQS